MSALEIFIRVTVSVIGLCVLLFLVGVAAADLADDESETSMLTKILEGTFLLMMFGAFIGAVISLTVWLVRWATGS